MKTKELKQFVTKAKKIYNKKNTLLVNEKVLIKDNQMIFTDLEFFLIWPCSFSVNNKLIDFPYLEKIVKKTKAKDIDIVESPDNENELIIKAGPSSFTTNEDFQVDEFPKLPKLESKTNDFITSVDAARIKKSLAYSANDDLRPAMNGVYLEKENIVSTDAHEMAYHKREKPGKTSVLLKRKTVGLMEDEQYNIQVGEKYSYLTGKTCTIVQYNEDERYPNWKAVIREGSPIQITGIDARKLIETLEEADISANQSSHMAIFHFSKEKGLLNIRARDLDFNKGYNCNLPFESMKGNSMSIGVNISRLLHILKNEKMDAVNFYLEDMTKVIHINDGLLLMPMMLDEVEDQYIYPSENELKAEIR